MVLSTYIFRWCYYYFKSEEYKKERTTKTLESPHQSLLNAILEHRSLPPLICSSIYCNCNHSLLLPTLIPFPSSSSLLHYIHSFILHCSTDAFRVFRRASLKKADAAIYYCEEEEEGDEWVHSRTHSLTHYIVCVEKTLLPPKKKKSYGIVLVGRSVGRSLFPHFLDFFVFFTLIAFAVNCAGPRTNQRKNERMIDDDGDNTRLLPVRSRPLPPPS